MSTHTLSREEAVRRIAALNDAISKGYPPPGVHVSNSKTGALSVAADALGIPRQTLQSSLSRIKALYGLEPISRSAAPEPAAEIAEAPKSELTDDALLALLRKSPATLAEIATRCGASKGGALDRLDSLQARGHNIHEINGLWSVEKDMVPGFVDGPIYEYVSRPDNSFVFGATSDNHLGSKYERLDVLNDLYDEFAKAGVDRVYNAGNWIDGEARFNKYDLKIHGMDAQCRYLAANYPQRKGITTYAVAGDDHEGWYAQREGVNIGKYAERVMREAGRDDWHDLGYMEAAIKLVNANTGKFSIMAVVHPGGGSAYALSYSIQKIIESLDGGEKPAVGLYGHYHKLWAGNIRNVWCLQTGCTEDQTTFMRKKKLEAHVGGTIVTLRQDPESGAITGFLPEMRRYFNKGFYQNRWSLSGDVTLPERGV